jgi:hypothetical protein
MRADAGKKHRHSLLVLAARRGPSRILLTCGYRAGGCQAPAPSMRDADRGLPQIGIVNRDRGSSSARIRRPALVERRCPQREQFAHRRGHRACLVGKLHYSAMRLTRHGRADDRRVRDAEVKPSRWHVLNDDYHHPARATVEVARPVSAAPWNAVPAGQPGADTEPEVPALYEHADPYWQGNARPLIAAGGQDASDCPASAAIRLEWVGLVARIPRGGDLAPQPGQLRTAHVEPAALLPPLAQEARPRPAAEDHATRSAR